MMRLLPAALVGVFVLALALERLFPGRPLPRVERWLAKGAFFLVLTFVIGGALPQLWVPFLTAHRLVDLRALGTTGGLAVAVLASEVLGYAWHRAQHDVPLLWRWTHQMHHSAERVDVAGTFYFHPLDSLSYALLSSGAGALLGVTPEAATLAGAAGFAMACFQHSNLKTPVWLGRLVQRPEAHAVHHQRGVHGFNYGNLTLLDQLLGTYRNPPTYGEAKAGFWDGASAEVLPMLLGRDVAEAPATTPKSPQASVPNR